MESETFFKDAICFHQHNIDGNNCIPIYARECNILTDALEVALYGKRYIFQKISFPEVKGIQIHVL